MVTACLDPTSTLHHFGIESITNIAAKIWNKIPNEILKRHAALKFLKVRLKNGFQSVALVDLHEISGFLYNQLVNI